MTTSDSTRSPRAGKFAAAAKLARNVHEEDDAPSIRPPLREEDSRTAAARRAAELRQHLGEVVDGIDDFYVPPDEIPDGWTYEWKRHSTHNQEDPVYYTQLLRAGWEAVPASRHPSMMPSNAGHGPILRKGMILMQCPTEIVEERHQAAFRKARMQVRAKETQIAGTPEGTLTRDDARVRPQIKKSYEAMPIPEK